jgi:hypothetical protein
LRDDVEFGRGTVDRRSIEKKKPANKWLAKLNRHPGAAAIGTQGQISKFGYAAILAGKVFRNGREAE